LTYRVSSMSASQIQTVMREEDIATHASCSSMKASHWHSEPMWLLEPLAIPNAISNDATLHDILDQVTQILFEEEGDIEIEPRPIGTQEVLFEEEGDIEIEPRPIGTQGVRIVPKLSIENDPAWQEDALMVDVINVLTSQKKRSRDHFLQMDISLPLKKERKVGGLLDFNLPSEKPLPDSQGDDKIKQVAASKNEESWDQTKKQRFRTDQAEQWSERFQDMIIFQNQYGHCCVPNVFAANPHVAQWVKRQRYQYKLKHEGKHTTLTDEREAALDQLGFVWDSHGAVWMERCNELADYRKKHGQFSNVPADYPENQQLPIWVKYQRRQYMLYSSGGHSNMTPERISKLESLDFVWNPRGLRDRR
jgi:hypothetical protein